MPHPETKQDVHHSFDYSPDPADRTPAPSSAEIQGDLSRVVELTSQGHPSLLLSALSFQKISWRKSNIEVLKNGRQTSFQQ